MTMPERTHTTEMLSSAEEPRQSPTWRFVCPACLAPLEAASDSLCCPADGRRYPFEAGIGRFLLPERAVIFEPFLRDYQTVRADEGWGRPDPAYYRSLPHVAADDPHWDVWQVRERSYATLIARVLRPLEADRGRPLSILDLGAGCGWLAYRLAQRGHRVAAIDISTDELDGVGAHVWYRETEARHALAKPEARCAAADTATGYFVPIQAEFDRLPFDGDQFDLVIFNASLHYSTNYPVTLIEALRVLHADGAIVMLDSPFYRNPASGAAMVRQREATFRQKYGFASDAIRTEGYLTGRTLQALAARLGIRWRIIYPIPRWRLRLRAWKARWRGEREPAAFPLVVGHWAPIACPAAPKPARWLWRQGLRWRFRLFQRHRYARLVLERVLGTPLLVLPGVFNPKLLRTGEFLVRSLDASLVPPGSRVLDLGTGSGIGAVFAARWAEHVVAVDLNPEAVRCARLNALLNHVDDRVDVRLGDLFSPVAEERFDVVLLNPPFFRGEPRDAADLAWHSLDLPERLGTQLGDHLTTGGHALVVLSSDGDGPAFLQAFRANRLAVDVVTRRDLINEVLTVYRVRKAR